MKSFLDTIEHSDESKREHYLKPEKPMKAKLFSPSSDMSVLEDGSSYIAEVKLQGHRCLWAPGMTWSGALLDMKVNFLEQIDLPYGTMLDGELHGPDGTAENEVSSMRAVDSPMLKMGVFDILYYNGKKVINSPLYERKHMMAEVLRSFHHPQVYMLPWQNDKKEELFEQTKKDGGEGIVLKNINTAYLPGSRGRWWYKWKHYDTVDVVIIDQEAMPTEWRVRPGEVDKQTGEILPEGDHSTPWKKGYRGLTYGFFDKHGKIVPCGTLGNTAPPGELKHLIWRVAAVKCWGHFPTGALKHPQMERLRDIGEKNPVECIFDFEKGKIVS